MSDETGGGSSRLTLISNRAGQIQVRYNKYKLSNNVNKCHLFIYDNHILESDGYQEE